MPAFALLMSGNAYAESTATGTLTVPVDGEIIGHAVSQAAASGTLQTGIWLSGAAAGVTSAAASRLILGPHLFGSAVDSSTATADMTAQIMLSGEAISESSAYAGLMPVDKTAFAWRFLCTLTGAADGLPDLLIPISSYNESQSVDSLGVGVASLQCVCPNGVDFAEPIAARPNGDLLLTAIKDYTQQYFDFLVSEPFSVDYVRVDHGSHNFSVSLTGRRTLVPRAGATVVLHDESYLATQSGGQSVVRCRFEPGIFPGDTASYSRGSLLVSRVSRFASVGSVFCEVAG